MKHALAIVIASLLSAPLPTLAQTPAESLSRCLADNTSGRDRKDLARWVFLSMAAHPEIKQHAAPDLAKISDETDKLTANMFTRLLAESCVKQTQAAYKQGGTVAIQTAFQTLGQLAMQELMSDAQVNASMGAFQKYLDQGKLNQAFGGK